MNKTLRKGKNNNEKQSLCVLVGYKCFDKNEFIEIGRQMNWKNHGQVVDT